MNHLFEAIDFIENPLYEQIISDIGTQQFSIIENFFTTEEVSVLPLENVLLFKDTKVLVIDSLATYKISQKPDIIILTQGTRVNLERVLQMNTPKIVIADNSNSKYKVENWKKTCPSGIITPRFVISVQPSKVSSTKRPTKPLFINFS